MKEIMESELNKKIRELLELFEINPDIVVGEWNLIGHLKQFIDSLLSKQREEMESKYYLVKKRDVSGYQKKYNKTEKRMNTNRHRYHKRVNKYFDDCSLCRKEL